MDALNTFLVANAVLSVLALAGFYAIRVTHMGGEERGHTESRLAGFSGVAMSVAMLSFVGSMFL
jgi:hypothetical protein